jgi:hypothetical protein
VILSRSFPSPACGGGLGRGQSARSANRPPPQAGEVNGVAAGRICPHDYRYAPSVFDRPPDIAAEVLYVVGGLYGNLAALDAVEDLAGREHAPVFIVFNGDFHWFDAEPDWFAAIDCRVARHVATRGNIETEVARPADIGAGCGCAYPATVGDDIVNRSNSILLALREAAPRRLAADLGRLAMHLVAQIGPLRVGIVHGDATALAGWRFDRTALDDPAARPWLTEVRAASRIDLFASTHTCVPALRDFALPSGRLTIINNGAAGMPNFADARVGLISRIAIAPSPHRALYGLVRDGVQIDAIPLEYDSAEFLQRFLSRWPAGSPAHASYFRRIACGPDDRVADAQPRSAPIDWNHADALDHRPGA